MKLKQNLKRAICAFMAGAMLLSLAACGGSSGSSGATASTQAAATQAAAGESAAATEAAASVDESEYVSGHASVRDTMNMGMGAEPTSMDPSKTSDLVTWIFILQTYDTLIKWDQEAQQFIPALASEWKVNDDSTEVEFTIRDDITFHNGEKMTMDDVMFSLNRALESPNTAQINGSIDHFEKIDDTHLKLVQKYGYAPILEVMVTPCWGIVSKKAVEECEAAGTDFGRVACGTGAYKLVSWDSGDKMVFEAFDDYYEGKPAIKNVIATLVADKSAGAIALENGTFDYYYSVDMNDVPHLKEVPTLNVISNDQGVGLYDITFNVTDGIFTDKRLRQAVAYALDREEILIGGQDGNGVVNDCFCATSAFGWLPDFKWYERDLDKARELLAEAGYPNGFDVVFKQDSSRTYMASAEIMQAQLAEIGINVTFEQLERATWLDVVATNRDYVASLRMTNHVVNDADYILTRRLTSGMLGGGNNYAGYQNPEFDAIVEEARMEPDENKRLELYRQCYEIIKEDVPVIPLYTNSQFDVINAKLQGWVTHPMYRTHWCKLWFSE